MGYTHYWDEHEFNDEQWDVLKENTQKIVRLAMREGIKLARDFDEIDAPPEITDESILLNGVGNEGHETFHLSKKGDWTFCKTAEKPYDRVVVAVLLLAQSMGLRVTSDGSDADDRIMRLEDSVFHDGAMLLSAALEEEA
jgi:hypothetical protein